MYEAITAILMIAGTFNFNLHAHIWRGERMEMFKNLEARTMAIDTLVFSMPVGLGLAGTSLYSESGRSCGKASTTSCR